MERRLAESGLSGLFVLVSGYALWPLEHVYWTVVAERAGALATIGIVVLLCAVAGAAARVATGVSLPNFAIGGSVAYVAGMVAVGRFVSPLVASEYAGLYALLLLGFVLGAAAATTRSGDASTSRVTAS